MSDLDNMKMKAEAKVEELAAKARYEAEKAEPDGGELADKAKAKADEYGAKAKGAYADAKQSVEDAAERLNRKFTKPRSKGGTSLWEDCSNSYSVRIQPKSFWAISER